MRLSATGMERIVAGHHRDRLVRRIFWLRRIVWTPACWQAAARNSGGIAKFGSALPSAAFQFDFKWPETPHRLQPDVNRLSH
jgi:hypothetical protein